MEPAGPRTDPRAKPQSADTGADVDQIDRLQKLKIWKKLKEGALHDITKKNVYDLFLALDVNDRGEISRDELGVLRLVPGIHLTPQDLEAFLCDCDKNGDGRITTEEIFKAFCEGELVFNRMKDSLGKNRKDVDERSLDLTKVIEFLSDEYETTSALWSLPQTLLLFALFLTLMSNHLDPHKAFNVQQALLNEIEGEGPPYLRDHEWAIVHDVPTMWQWLESSFISLHFKNAEGELDNFPFPGRVASFNQMMGGMELTKIQVREPQLCNQPDDLVKLYDSSNGFCYDSETTVADTKYLLYHENLDTIRAHLEDLRGRVWVDQNSTSLDIHTLFLNAHLHAFTDCRLKFVFQRSGTVKITIVMETWGSAPYHSPTMFVVDAMFVSIVLKMLWSESQELIPAIRSGLDGLAHYAEFWNMVDWISIFFGGMVVAFWFLVQSGLSSLVPMLLDLPVSKYDADVLENRTYLPSFSEKKREEMTEKIQDLLAKSTELAGNHLILRMLFFIYGFVLMLKFFKAFQANPRLDIVIRTLTKSAVEIIHFGIVFLVIFVCFSSSGYVVWGGQVWGFRSQFSSFTTCWRILMGEFDLVGDMEMSNQGVTYIWLICFQFLVLLILLNMLLAIIMDTYVAAKQEAGDPEDQVTIWNQIKEAFYTLRKTRGHIKIYDVLLELQDEDYPAHPQPIVTSKSLRRAFSKMTKHQADYLLKRTAEHVRSKAQELDIGLSDTVRILSLLRLNVQRNCSSTQEVLETLKVSTKAAQDARFDAILYGDEKNAMHDQLQKMPTNVPMPGTVPPQVAVGIAGLSGSQNRQTQEQSQSAKVGVMNNTQGVAGMNNTIPQYNANLDVNVNAGGDLAAMLMDFQSNVKCVLEENNRVLMNIAQQTTDMQQYLEERDSWFEKRMIAMDRRCDKIERSNETVLSTINAEFPELIETVRQLRTNTPVVGNKFVRMPSTMGKRNVREDHFPATGSEVENASESPQPPAVTPPNDKRVLQHLKSLQEQMVEMLSLAHENAQSGHILWKIDLGIRNLRKEVVNKDGTRQRKSISPSRRTEDDDKFQRLPGVPIRIPVDESGKTSTAESGLASAPLGLG